MRALGCVLLGAFLASCEVSEKPVNDDDTEAGPVVSSATPTGTAPPPVPPDDSSGTAIALPGEYRVAGVDGGDINLPHGITATIGEDRIEVTSQCVEMAWSYRLEGTSLETTRLPIVTCDRGRYPEEEAIEAAFTAAREVERTSSNGLRFSGGGRSVTLFTQ